MRPRRTSPRAGKSFSVGPDAQRSKELLDGLAAVDELVDGRVDAEVRLARVALGEEEVERIDVARSDAEVAGVGVEIDAAVDGAMHAAEIDGELAVDEHEQVVVAGEGEDLSGVVTELRPQ